MPLLSFVRMLVAEEVGQHSSGHGRSGVAKGQGNEGGQSQGGSRKVV